MSPAWLLWLGGVLAFAVGVWVGLGAPGWPRPPRPAARLRHREINPIVWGRSGERERPRPRRPGERRPPPR